jgi:glutaredoxin
MKNIFKIFKLSSILTFITVAFFVIPVMTFAQETVTVVNQANTSSNSAETAATTQAPVVLENASIKVIIYTTTTCPHCKNVKAFVSTNNVQNVEFRNVDTDQKFLDEFNALYSKYNTPEANRGVPVLEADGALISGDQPIIAYLTKVFNVTPKPIDTTIQTSSSDWAFIGIGGFVLFAIIGYGVYSVLNKK